MNSCTQDVNIKHPTKEVMHSRSKAIAQPTVQTT